MRDFRTFTSRRIREQLEQQRHYGFLHIIENAAGNLPDQQYRLWTEDYHPIALTSEKWFNQKLTYMHDNPVRKGFVEKPEAWKYSSARNWLLNDHCIIKIMKLDSEYT